MSKEVFFEMRANDVAKMYDHTFTKKEAILTGAKLVEDVVENGEVNPHEFMANLARLKEVVNSADAEMRKHLPEEKFTAFGVDFTPIQGGKTLQYADDPIYEFLKKQLKDREELLKLAFNSDLEIYDSEGAQVPKVSFINRKSSITIKF